MDIAVKFLMIEIILFSNMKLTVKQLLLTFDVLSKRSGSKCNGEI